jgi:ABC-type multidrug transport system ATPase subunit
MTEPLRPGDVAVARRRGVRIDVDQLSRRIRFRREQVTLLDAVSFTVSSGELVAIVGPSGAGKTTLLEAMAGIAPASSGSVRFDGTDVYGNLSTFRSVLGYVPQDDIIHADLPLERTLLYAARLRLPSSTTTAEIDLAVRDALGAVGLTDQAVVRVASLSGGQRKRASIAVELLTNPHLFFLDEPTSGLDPITSSELVGRLRELANQSATVVFTTHSVEDLAACDRIVCVTRGGRLGFVGTVEHALDLYGVSTVPELYRHLTDPNGTHRPAVASTPGPAPDVRHTMKRRPVASGLTQWGVLTRRTLETLVRNRLTLAILIGSPAMVIGMFAILFQRGAFDFENPSPSSMVMIGFWVVFAAFFFGLTYGLLQICTERAILRREYLVGLRLGAYVASKVTVLVPFILVVIVGMLGVLRLLGRLPSRSLSTYASIGITLALCSVAALGLGLLTSATVGTVPQATLALPMLCFPAVLFSGAILPVHLMAGTGAALSTVIPTRWAFEAIGHDLGARRILAEGGSPLGPPLLESYGNAGTQPVGSYWLILVGFAAVFLVATWPRSSATRGRLNAERWDAVSLARGLITIRGLSRCTAGSLGGATHVPRGPTPSRAGDRAVGREHGTPVAVHQLCHI